VISAVELAWLNKPRFRLILVLCFVGGAFFYRLSVTKTTELLNLVVLFVQVKAEDFNVEAEPNSETLWF
jgi:hypothetical protein